VKIHWKSIVLLLAYGASIICLRRLFLLSLFVFNLISLHNSISDSDKNSASDHTLNCFDKHSNEKTNTIHHPPSCVFLTSRKNNNIGTQSKPKPLSDFSKTVVPLLQKLVESRFITLILLF